MNVTPRDLMNVNVDAKQCFNATDLLRMAAELSLGIEPADVAPPTMRAPLFTGRYMAREVQPGLIATASDISYLRDQSVTVDIDASLICGILLDGHADEMNIAGHGRVAKCLERPVLVGFGARATCGQHILASRRIRDAGFILRPNFFERFGEHVSDDGLSVLREFVTARFSATTLVRSPSLLEIARRSLDHPYNGHLGVLFLESNTLAFVIEIANLLRQERQQVAAIGKRHYDRVIEARDILDRSIVSPPSTLELARLVGVNITTLQANFKRVFATTIFGYVRDQRLMMAQVLLREHHLLAGEVGRRMGFSNPSAFAAAYKRRFGYSPTEERGRSAH